MRGLWVTVLTGPEEFPEKWENRLHVMQGPPTASPQMRLVSETGS